MKNRYLIIMLAAAAAAVLFMPGASHGRHDLGELEFVRCMGFDMGDTVRVTATVTPGESEQEEDTEVVSGEGKSINEAVEEIKIAHEKSTFFGYVSQYVIGEETALAGVGDIMDYACRDVYSRLDTPCYIVKGAAAAELIKGANDEERSLSRRLIGLEDERGGVNLPVSIDIREILSAMERTGSCLVPGLRQEGDVVALDGYGIIKDARLIGWVEKELVPAANMLAGEKGALMVTVELKDGGVISANIASYKRDFHVEVDGDKVTRCLIELDVDADLAGVMGIDDVDEQADEIVKLIEDELNTDAKKVLRLSAEMEADFLDLAGAISLRYGEKDCGGAAVAVGVKVDLARSYEITDK